MCNTKNNAGEKSEERPLGWRGVGSIQDKGDLSQIWLERGNSIFRGKLAYAKVQKQDSRGWNLGAWRGQSRASGSGMCTYTGGMRVEP